MTVRTASLADLSACRHLDGSCMSEFVWNMRQQEEDGRIVVYFDEVRLPRAVFVPYPAALDDLLERHERGECLLVVEEGGVRGFLAARWERCTGLVWVDHLIVEPAWRRRGAGRSLVRQAAQWARQRNARALILGCQAKNGPAIRFCQNLGFELAGYNEHQYGAYDIALLFAYQLC
jgi:GNAT superfamily N-acetyltransferase